MICEVLFYTFPKKSFFILLRIWLCFATAQVVTSWIDVVHHHRFLPSDIFKLERSGWKNPNKCIHLSAIIGRQAARIFIAKNHLRSLPSSPPPFHLSKVERVLLRFIIQSLVTSDTKKVINSVENSNRPRLNLNGVCVT